MNWGGGGGFVYHPFFLNGEFYEYHLSCGQFKNEIRNAGFELLKLVPSEDQLGICSHFNKNNKTRKIMWAKDFMTFESDWRGRLLLRLARAFPFLISHFQIAICRRPPEK
ncbi:hypothetical protein FACS1894108_12460 [Planctomycetales bacterium]|nr:hypothetical protein FACS1894108_12460 [Planctomycetales bacterium]